ncbi:MAG: DUF4236 domain-containing protein [Myxococcota bacterium]
MSFRFWRRIKIAPGVTLNLSKRGASVSLGPRGAKLTLGRSGARATAGIPGTGLFYTRRVSASKRAAQIEPGFLERLSIPFRDRALIDGCRALAAGDERQALERLGSARRTADAAFLAGCLALKLDRLDEADDLLSSAGAGAPQLGQALARYDLDASVDIAITDEVAARLVPSIEGVRLARVEVAQRRGRLAEALGQIEQLHRDAPEDLTIRISLAELLLEVRPIGPDVARRVVTLTDGLENASPLETAALLYRARALRSLGLARAAREACSLALRRRGGRPQSLRLALRYERALCHADLGHAGRERAELERIYALDAGYADVADRLGSKA